MHRYREPLLSGELGSIPNSKYKEYSPTSEREARGFLQNMHDTLTSSFCPLSSYHREAAVENVEPGHMVALLKNLQ